MTPLESYLRRLIARHGPITIAEYMALCLSHPEHGYYQSRDPLGQGGDFTTAPEISQMFGEVIAAWCIETWISLGSPAFNLVEFGPGRGTLLRDLLRVAAKIRPNFVSAMTLYLIETSPVLRQAQCVLLDQYRPVWCETLSDIPAAPSIFLMNEFLDALPIRQFVLADAGLCERRIEVEEDRLTFVVEREPRVRLTELPLALGSIVETCPAALAVTRELAGRIKEQGGAALIVDYGYARASGEDTFQALRDHAYADVLRDPGECDLTAHVDFGALARAALEIGVKVEGPVGQGEFLTGLGIQYRARTLIEAGDANAEAALHRLTNAEEMGELFKVLVLKK